MPKCLDTVHPFIRGPDLPTVVEKGSAALARVAVNLFRA
jgi:hypothetical protein